ncbi:nitrile hydratase subunit alpha [Chelatococcus reniformis]|uniref:Nitrile hydratase subunit alpha n=1 Tax=Chelatococcus reniformis TaxID=1494448 RepID=A0A916X734_9HYPH|nr:nitrile hydratase subunit alpha [Chelatococcus reniformis]GGC50177.1 nitrile hydratase subunit alpha [Chelatococcus reniformis]
MSDQEHTHDHAHSHDHAHDGHEPLVVEDEAGNIEGQILVDALQTLLVERGLVFPGEVRREIERIEAPGVHLGAKIVARAWVDDDFRTRLLADGKSAVAELGIGVGEAQLIVVANDADTHNFVCCTLCSCYPRSILGQPPAWYISKAYRARAVREPRAVLEEFGLVLPDGVRVLVHDSNADMRYLVLPQRPKGSEGLGEDQLAGLITRDCMIGVSVVGPVA